MVTELYKEDKNGVGGWGWGAEAIFEDTMVESLKKKALVRQQIPLLRSTTTQSRINMQENSSGDIAWKSKAEKIQKASRGEK